jgi:hypothetical protein
MANEITRNESINNCFCLREVGDAWDAALSPLLAYASILCTSNEPAAMQAGNILESLLSMAERTFNEELQENEA